MKRKASAAVLFKALHVTADKQKTASGLTANGQAQSDTRRATGMYTLSLSQKKKKIKNLNNEKFDQWKQCRDRKDAMEEATVATGKCLHQVTTKIEKASNHFLKLSET